MSSLTFLREVKLPEVLDILIVALFVYGVLVWLKRTQRAAYVFTGVIIVAAVYMVATQFQLAMTAAMLKAFFAVVAIALVVIFQEELRTFFERIARWALYRRFSRSRRHETEQSFEVLVRTVPELASKKIGVLIVLPGKDPIVRHLDGGDGLDGELSDAILKSIFDPNSIGHDGAVVIDGDRIRRFGCHLPLSKNMEALRGKGTRHAAALGLAERTDALVLVASEERGDMSIARHGRLETVKSPGELHQKLEAFFGEVAPEKKSSPVLNFFRRNSREKIIALGLTATLWFVLVHGGKEISRTFYVPVEIEFPPQFREGILKDAEGNVVDVEPPAVTVTLTGPQRSFYFLGPDDLSARLVHAGEELKYRAKADDVRVDYPKNRELEISVTGQDIPVYLVPASLPEEDSSSEPDPAGA